MKINNYIDIILVTFCLSTFMNCFSFNSFKLLDTPVKTLELNEILISGSEKDKILVISIDGVISDRSSADTFGLSQKESMIARIKEE